MNTDNTSQPTAPDATGPDDERYEAIVDQLEELVERIESGEIGLEDSIRAYERGVTLIARARAILARAEQRIEEIDLETLRRRASGDESS